MTRLIALLDALGTALILQLAFVVCSLPVITVIPAAIALQRSLADQRLGEKVGVRSFATAFALAWRQYWPAGVGGAALALAFIVSGAFWLAADSAVGRVAVGVLALLWGVFGALYLAALAASDEHREYRSRELGRAARELLVKRPLPALLALMLFGGWLVLMGFVPTLVLVGSGLVPALIAYGVLGPRRVTQESRGFAGRRR